MSEHKRLPTSVSAAIFIEDNLGRLLLLQQADQAKGNLWGPPSGGIEAHEDPLMGALREANEELGAEVKLIDVLGIYPVDRGDFASGIGFVFRGKLLQTELCLKEGEISEARFFSNDEIAQLIAQGLLYKPEYNIQAIEDWITGEKYPLDIIRPIIQPDK